MPSHPPINISLYRKKRKRGRPAIVGVDDAVLKAISLMHAAGIFPCYGPTLMAWLDIECSQSTVYRTLKKLVQDGFLVRENGHYGHALPQYAIFEKKIA